MGGEPPHELRSILHGYTTASHAAPARPNEPWAVWRSSWSHEHCPRVSLASVPPCEPTVGPNDAAGPGAVRPVCSALGLGDSCQATTFVEKQTLHGGPMHTDTVETFTFLASHLVLQVRLQRGRIAVEARRRPGRRSCWPERPPCDSSGGGWPPEPRTDTWQLHFWP